MKRGGAKGRGEGSGGALTEVSQPCTISPNQPPRCVTKLANDQCIVSGKLTMLKGHKGDSISTTQVKTSFEDSLPGQSPSLRRQRRRAGPLCSLLVRPRPPKSCFNVLLSLHFSHLSIRPWAGSWIFGWVKYLPGIWGAEGHHVELQENQGNWHPLSLSLV